MNPVNGVYEENPNSIDINNVGNVLSSLQLIIIPQEFVDQVINSNYKYCKFPETFELFVMPYINFPTIINQSCELLNIYLQQSPSKYILWDQIISDGTYFVHPKPLSCLLNCYIQNAIKDMHQPSTRKNGLSATRLFFLMSTFKDSKNVEFFHIYILTKCTELIKSCISMLHNTNDIINNDNVQLDEDEKNDMMIDLLHIVKDITIMIKQFQFFDEFNSLDLIIEIMIDVTRLERISGNILKRVPTETLSFGTLAFNAYSGLLDMFNDNCGSTFIIGQKLMSYMLSGLLVDGQYEMQLTTKQFNVIRDHHLSFICNLTKKLGNSFEYILEILLHHLLHRGPDRSELKPRQFQIILEVWRLCPNNVRIKIKYYLLRMVYDINSKMRIVALETLFKLLSEPEEIEPEDPKLLPLMPATKHEFILAVILSKFQDEFLTVRVKAFSLFISLTAGPPTSTAYQTALIKRVLVDPYHENLNKISFSKKDFHDFFQYLKDDMANFDPNNITNYNIYPGIITLLWVLYVHTYNERAHVRHLSLTLIFNLFLINNKFLMKFYLSSLVNNCLDYSMTVRKVVVSGLTELVLKYPDNQDVLEYWFKGLIYLVDDGDKKIQELTVECMNRVILKNIKPYSANFINNNDPLDYLPWLILGKALNEQVDKYMMCLCEKWRINGFLTDCIVENVITYIDSSDNEWTGHSLYMLQFISHQLIISNMYPVIRYFDTHFNLWFSNEEDLVKLNKMLTHGQMLLDIICLNHKVLNKEISQQLLNTFEDLIFNFKVPTRLISKSLDLYIVLQTDDLNKRDQNLKKLFEKICNSIETSTNRDNKEILMRLVFTLGDIGLVQHIQIQHKFQQYLLDFLDNSDQTVSSDFQAIVVLTIGKLSIVNEQLAKKAIIQFGVILKKSYHPSIKINALTALADLCLQCTILVEQVIPEMCVCLRTDNLSVKRVALKLLIGLILEDHIKLKNGLFFTLLCMLNDRDPQVYRETSSFIVHYLLIKNKNIMEQKLIEAIFHFNSYTGVSTSSTENYFTNPEMKAYFSMEGDTKKISRHCVYRFMLTHMSDESKLKLMVKIFNVFEVIIKDVNTTENNELNKCAAQVMRDAFWILKVKEMALKSIKLHGNSNDDDVETLEKENDIVKKQVIRETYKTVMTDYIIPNVLKLKYDLNKNKNIGPIIMNDLRKYLCVLISKKSTIKTEIIELLSIDSELIAEITYDLKQMKQSHKPDDDNNLEKYNSKDDEETRVIEDLECVTWEQVVKMYDHVEDCGLDKSIEVQMQVKFQQKTLETTITENFIQDVTTFSAKNKC